MVIDSATASGPGGRPAAVTASSRTVGEDEDAGTGLSLVIDGVRHLQITTRPVPALKRPAQTLASRLCSDPAACLARRLIFNEVFSPGFALRGRLDEASLQVK